LQRGIKAHHIGKYLHYTGIKTVTQAIWEGLGAGGEGDDRG